MKLACLWNVLLLLPRSLDWFEKSCKANLFADWFPSIALQYDSSCNIFVFQIEQIVGFSLGDGMHFAVLLCVHLISLPDCLLHVWRCSEVFVCTFLRWVGKRVEVKTYILYYEWYSQYVFVTVLSIKDVQLIWLFLAQDTLIA